MNSLNDLPEDFCPVSYKKYNPDLQSCSDDWVCWHYLNYGIKENRIYKIKNLPEDFEPDHYLCYNLDLKGYTIPQAEAHYANHGLREKRKYKDDLFDISFFKKYNNLPDATYKDYFKNIKLIKSEKVLNIINNIPENNIDVLLVDHQSTINGASHHLYLLYNFLVENYNLNVSIATPFIRDFILNKYNIPLNCVYEYLEDPTILFYTCTKLKCKKIYYNSLNLSMVLVSDYLEKSKLILHTHEIKEHYHSICYPRQLIPHFNISKEDILSYSSEAKNIHHQTGIMPISFFKKIELDSQKKVFIKNHKGKINLKKITIGMSGTLCERKNYKLFVETSKALPDYNFLWVGGEGILTDEEIGNLYHVPHTPFPFSYYKMMDYFILYSSVEPMGYVLLENLCLGNQVIAFNDSLVTKFDKCGIEDLYTVIEGTINFNKLVEVIPKICNKKPVKNSKKGQNYVKNFFKVNENFIKIFL